MPKPEISHPWPWQEEELLRSLLFDYEVSPEEIAEEYEVSSRTIYNWIDKHGIKRDRKVWRPYPWAEDPHTVPFNQIESEMNPYEVWTHLGSAVRVHRLQMVAELGLDAVSGKVIHHVNEIPWDNRVENLELMDNADHVSHHSNTRGEMPVEGF